VPEVGIDTNSSPHRRVHTPKVKCSDNGCWVSSPVGNHNVVEPFFTIMGLANIQQDVETYVEDNKDGGYPLTIHCGRWGGKM